MEFIYFCLTNIINKCAKFEENLYIGFRDTSFLHKLSSSEPYVEIFKRSCKNVFTAN